VDKAGKVKVKADKVEASPDHWESPRCNATKSPQDK
jgi:ribosomal protein S30